MSKYKATVTESLEVTTTYEIEIDFESEEWKEFVSAYDHEGGHEDAVIDWIGDKYLDPEKSTQTYRDVDCHYFDIEHTEVTDE